MGRASNRKKANRQAAHRTGQARQSSRADAATQQAMLQLAAGLQQVLRKVTARTEQGAAARRAWCGGRGPAPAVASRWPEGSLGDRFVTGSYLAEVRKAPCLLTADIPDATVIAADPSHWNVAASALVRAVVFDGLKLDHPAVSMLLEVLAPMQAGGDTLENLVAAGAVKPANVLPVGLTVLSALAELCRSGSASLLRRAA